MKRKETEALLSWKRLLLRTLSCVMASMVLTAFLFFLFRGIPFFGLPKAPEVASIFVEDSHQWEKEFQDEEKIQQALNLCSSLTWLPGAAQQGKALLTYTFVKKDGTLISLGVNDNTIFFGGTAYRRKNHGTSFQKLSEAVFFWEEAAPDRAS